MKQLKSIFTLMIACVFAVTGFAQSTDTGDAPQKDSPFSFRLGAKLGFHAMTNISFTDDVDFQTYQWEPTTSFIYGASSELMFSKRFGLQVEAQFTRKGLTAKPAFDYTQKISMLEVPMYLKITDLEGDHFGSFFSGSDFNTGVLVGPIYGINTGVVEKSGSEREKTDIKDTDYKRSHWQLGLYAMADGNIADGHRVGLQIGGKIGITDLGKDESFTQLFRSLDVSLIYYIPTKFKR